MSLRYAAWNSSKIGRIHTVAIRKCPVRSEHRNGFATVAVRQERNATRPGVMQRPLYRHYAQKKETGCTGEMKLKPAIKKTTTSFRFSPNIANLSCAGRSSSSPLLIDRVNTKTRTVGNRIKVTANATNASTNTKTTIETKSSQMESLEDALGLTNVAEKKSEVQLNIRTKMTKRESKVFTKVISVIGKLLKMCQYKPKPDSICTQNDDSFLQRKHGKLCLNLILQTCFLPSAMNFNKNYIGNKTDYTQLYAQYARYPQYRQPTYYWPPFSCPSVTNASRASVPMPEHAPQESPYLAQSAVQHKPEESPKEVEHPSDEKSPKVEPDVVPEPPPYMGCQPTPELISVLETVKKASEEYTLKLQNRAAERINSGSDPEPVESEEPQEPEAPKQK